jgi:hypothetical protein
MIRSNGVQANDLITEGHGFVYDQLQELMRRRLPREELKLSVNRPTPGDDDTCSDLK